MWDFPFSFPFSFVFIQVYILAARKCITNMMNDLNHKVRLSKTVCGTFHFRFHLHLFLFKFIFWFNKMYKNIRLILFCSQNSELQQGVLKFNNMCVSWSSPKADLETNFLNLENRSFENISF